MYGTQHDWDIIVWLTAENSWYVNQQIENARYSAEIAAIEMEKVKALFGLQSP